VETNNMSGNTLPHEQPSSLVLKADESILDEVAYHVHQDGFEHFDIDEPTRQFIQQLHVAAGDRSKNEDGLSWPGIGTRKRLIENSQERQLRLEKMYAAVRVILECLGEDPAREGLLKTPERYAHSLLYFSKGYETNLPEAINGALFTEQHDDMVIVKNINIYSLCEHHLVPFLGKVSIGYIPNGLVLGLSKLARITEMYSRRLQIQERLTKQIAFSIQDTLQPRGCGVVIEASHMCMVMRGVQKSESITITSCMLGSFREDPKTREEFLSLIAQR
jgi:GTP cyclohydrolase I